MAYPKAFRETIIRKLLSPWSPGLRELARTHGVSKNTVMRWRAEYQRSGMEDDDLKKRPQDWPAEEKFQAVMDTANLNKSDLGAYCRRNGLHGETLEIWRETCLTSIRKGPRINPVEKALKKENHELKRDLRRKEKALAEATALLILKKKAALIWGEDGEDEGD